MTPTAQIRCGLAAAVFLLYAGRGAAAQVDYRADNRVPGSDGRVLDSNSLRGSRGVNQPRVAGFGGGLRANAIITGNVTGLARFHAQSPVLQNNQFRATLPSSGLSRFNATSVGVGEVRANRALSPTFYYGRAETFADLGFIRSGLTQPGSSQLITPFITPPRITTPTLTPLASDLFDPTDARISRDPMISGLGMRQREVVLPADLSFPRASTEEPFAGAVGSSIFGTPGPSTVMSRSAAGPDRLNPTRLGRPDRAVPLLDGSVKDLVPTTWMPIGQVGDQGLDPPEGRLGTTHRPIGIAPGVAANDPASSEGAPRDLGGDRFSDLLRAVEAAERSGVDRLGFLGRGVADPQSGGSAGDGAEIDRRSPMVDADGRRPGRGVAELSTTVRWASVLLDNPIETFAGKYRGRLNSYLASAEEEMGRGQYYRAAGQFELAMTVDPRNPLPLLGRGHALLAAGDYVSALRAIESGIRLFPQIAAFRLDLPALAGRHDAFDLRRADIENRLSQAEHYELRFLLGYLELYSGLEEEGLRDLDRAAEAAPPDRVIAIFPDLIRGRRPLPPLGQGGRH